MISIMLHNRLLFVLPGSMRVDFCTVDVVIHWSYFLGLIVLYRAEGLSLSMVVASDYTRILETERKEGMHND